MTKDHYVSQVYLKYFSSREDKKIYVYQKNLYKIECSLRSTKSICHENGRDSNKYFNKKEWKSYLLFFENNWNKCISHLEKKEINESIKLFLSEYISILYLNSPIVEKYFIKKRKHIIKDFFWKIEEKGGFSSLETPKEIQEKLDKREEIFDVEIDEKLMHAENLSRIGKMADTLFKSPWQIIFNNTDVSFLTSDYPVKDCCLSKESPSIIFIAITPKISIFIHDNKDEKFPEDCDKNGICYGTIIQSKESKEIIKNLNLCTIQSAEKYIVSDKKDEKIEDLVRKNKNAA